MQAFLRLVRPPRRARIVDLGGTEYMWGLVDHDFHVTLVNLPGSGTRVSDASRFSSLEADACELDGLFSAGEFDVAFSNSTIEHVGQDYRQRRFAEQVRRIACAYWVQTPSDRFPIEAHSGVPCFWRLPDSIRRWMLRRWQKSLPVWSDMFIQTRVLSLDQMRTLFPDGGVYRERRFLFEKSYALYRPYPAPSA